MHSLTSLASSGNTHYNPTIESTQQHTGRQMKKTTRIKVKKTTSAFLRQCHVWRHPDCHRPVSRFGKLTSRVNTSTGGALFQRTPKGQWCFCLENKGISRGMQQINGADTEISPSSSSPPPSYLDKWELLSAAWRRWEIWREYARNTSPRFLLIRWGQHPSFEKRFQFAFYQNDTYASAYHPLKYELIDRQN